MAFTDRLGLKHMLIICAFLYCVSYPALSAANHDIHQICQKSPSNCLAKIDHELKSTTAESRLWFSLLQYKIDSLFNLKKIQSLKKNIAPWIDADGLPITFQVSVYIYHVKTLPKNVSITKKQYYINKAKDQLALLNDIYPNPIKLVQLANLQLTVGEAQEAYQRLKSIEDKYSRRNEPSFQMELYANLGHAAHKLKLAEEKIDYYIKALEWSIEFGNQQQIAVSYYNVAKSQLGESQFKQAVNSFSKSMKYSQSSNDKTLFAQAQLFLAKSHIELQQHKDAYNILTQTQLTDMPITYKALYKELLALTQQHVN